MQQIHQQPPEGDHPLPLQATGRWPARLGPYELRYDVCRGYDRPAPSSTPLLQEPAAPRSGSAPADELEKRAP